jgi:hypothetical protein
MTKMNDLYAIMRAYANKNQSPFISLEEFIPFLAKYVHRLAAEQPEWEEWTRDTTLKFWNAMGAYTEDGRCVLLTDTPEGRVYMPYYVVDRLQEAFRDPDASADIPFPNEDSLKVNLPPDQVLMLSLETDLPPYLDKPAASFLPVIKLVFTENRLEALLLPPMIPHRLLEAAILKVRYYLKQHNNKEYATRKLLPMMQGREGSLRKSMDMVVTQPLDCLSAIEGGGEVTYSFWASLCSFIKSEIRKKAERLSSDIAVLEGVHVVETCLNLFKTRLQRERLRETALRTLDQMMDRAPYYFTQDQIAKFTDSKGTPLLGQYSESDLNTYLKKKLSESPDGELPEWLAVQGKNGEQYFLKKDKYLPLVTRFIIDAQGVIKQEISTRWIAMLNEFRTEPAMEKDADFERLLASLNASLNPLLHSFLEDKKLLAVYNELERTEKVIPLASRIFDRGKLIPYSLLFVIKRKEMIFDAKMALPFWYSLPIISSIVAFFFGLGQKKKGNRPAAKKPGKPPEQPTGGEAAAAREQTQNFVSSVRKIETQLVPINKGIDDYLAELRDHWGQILDPRARQNLVDDVNALVRDNLRQSVRVRKKQPLSTANLQDLALGIVNGTPSLRNLKGRDAILLYIQIYMVKLLKNMKP